jgi:hypothetical protein
MENEHHHHSSGKSHLTGLEGFFDTYLRIKAPFQLPARAKEFIVQYGPWISLVLLILSALVIIPLLALALGITVITLPFQAAAGTLHATTSSIIQLVITVVVLVLEAAAIPALLKRKLSGWMLIYYAILLSAVGSLIQYQIVSTILSLLIGMYILFQIREYYR